VKSRGQAIEDVKGDGNCFYRALAKMLPAFGCQEDNHLAIRKQTVEYLRRNEGMFRQTLELDGSQKTIKLQYEEYCAKHDCSGDYKLVC
jgi:hypothetical protein